MAIDIRLPLLAQAPDTSQAVAQGIETFRQARLDPYRQALLQMQVESNRAAAERSRLLAPLEAQAQQLAIEEAQFQASPEQRELERRRAAAAASLSESQAKLMGVQAELAPKEQSLRRLQLEAQRKAYELQAEQFKAEQTEAKNKVYESFAARVSPLLDQLETSDDPTVAGAAFAAFDKIASTMLSPEDAQEIVGSAGLPEVRGFIRAMAPKQVKEQKELTTQDIAKLPLQERVDYLNTQAQLEGKNTKTVGNNIFMQEFVVQDGKVVPIIKPIEGATPQQDQSFLDQLDKNPGLRKYYTDIGKQLAQTETTKGSVIKSAESFVELLNEMIANKEGRIAAQGPIASRTATFSEDALKYERDLERLKGSLFLKEVPNMAGMGSLSNAEGAKVAAAASNLDLVLSPENALAELKRLRESAIKVPLVIAADTERLQQLLTTPVGGGLRVPGERVPIERRMAELSSQYGSWDEVRRILQEEGYFQ
jgi:hypothetical protein